MVMELLKRLLQKLLNGDRYWLTRLVLQRGMALVYLIAFIIIIQQFKPLLGEHGLLPVPRYLEQIRLHRLTQPVFLVSSGFCF